MMNFTFLVLKILKKIYIYYGFIFIFYFFSSQTFGLAFQVMMNERTNAELEGGVPCIG
ncbi:hypothetical protein L873DRAFT_80187 [Choiromyces venosus 120613-1]|uniref:Uncharacterized protein n=1 Tax=Choiromyces venosus 120613-1 TaxID=1336337 RepID=A0A3N4J9L8_9PEZI|nr:hypothetical protein L873DRAFT_80187 [Choiromyces venosus 120613-1]